MTVHEKRLVDCAHIKIPGDSEPHFVIAAHEKILVEISHGSDAGFPEDHCAGPEKRSLKKCRKNSATWHRHAKTRLHAGIDFTFLVKGAHVRINERAPRMLFEISHLQFKFVFPPQVVAIE